jgi:excisionase family DNA binding protein
VSDPESQSLLTAEAVAQRLGVPTSWVYEQSRLGRIPTVSLGRYRRYRPEAIDAWVEELEGREATRPTRKRFRARRGREIRARTAGSTR